MQDSPRKSSQRIAPLRSVEFSGQILRCRTRDFGKQNEARKSLQFVYRDDKTNKVFHLIIIATWTQSKPNGDKPMIICKLKSAVPTLMVALICNSGVNAGTYKHITVDGNFSDWAGIPVAYTQPPDTTQSIAYTNIYVANDENYLYIRFAISTSDDPFTSLQNIFIDADNNPLTGYSAGGYVGSEMLVQGGAGYQEKAGNFNAGGINGLDWLAAPAGPATEFELRIARNATYASDATPVFASDTIALVLESETNFTPTEWVPPVLGGLLHTVAC